MLNNPVIKEFSVSEISNKIKELLEVNFGFIRVKGEITGLKIASSGHGYFNLKENSSILACTCWRPILSKITFPLNDGMEVVVSGKLSGYGGNSRYQLSVERLEPAGVGAMMQILQERKAKLEKEGLFNKIKKPLPFLPKTIGVVTSITGAVIKDIIHRITDRFPSHILIWPVSVQGENAAQEITDAIEGFNKLEVKPDVIIVARGGGSIEDLWSFNEEIVVRAVYNSVIPIISAVGHEVDYTLIDFVSDKRAPTPTAAAEFAVPVLSGLNYTLKSHYSSLVNRINYLIRYNIQAVNNNEKINKYLANSINHKQQLIDELGFKLLESFPKFLKLRESKLTLLTTERINPTKIISYKLLELTHQTNYMIKSMSTNIENLKHQISLNSTMLASLDYNKVLKRGFAIIKDDTGMYISSKSSALAKEKFNIKFFDGELSVNNNLKG